MTTSKTSSNENKTGSDNLTDYGVWLKIFALIIPFIAVTSSAFYGCLHRMLFASGQRISVCRRGERTGCVCTVGSI